MEQYKTAEGISSKQPDLDNFLQQLDYKLQRLVEVKERLQSKVHKMYGGGIEGVVKEVESGEPVFISTVDTLKYKLNWLEDVVEDISDLTTKIEEFI